MRVLYGMILKIIKELYQDVTKNKSKNKLYILLDEEVEEREEKSLLAIKDNYPKIILTMDKNYHKQLEGIRVINIVDWLLGL